MPTDPRRVDEVATAALELTDPDERTALIDRECGDDLELRESVTLRLEDRGPDATDPDRTADLAPTPDPDPDATLERPSELGLADDPDRTADVATPVAGPGRRPADPVLGVLIADRYRVVREIGEGGMGSVYLADQVRPVKRQVALKLIRAGMDSRGVLARFDSERQALALMDHPHIARVLDAGETDQGRPFFVMELVKGVPLTEYCDAHRLDVNARLDLFRQVCSAVQHAHQKGIIHRDLKPSNILVEEHDGKPVPKVIDFGLAKAFGEVQLSDHSMMTAFGSIAGTPLYMAPEQAGFAAVDVDTRADIYALGVILYELLTGSTPIRRETLQRAALDEVLRVIREEEPPTPSSRLGSSDALPSIAATRQAEPSRLGRLVRGDLDWIAMKALAKDRARRYESASALSEDVGRFLDHEPVSAGPPSAAYRLRKFVRRHRGRVVAASLVLLALVGGIVGTTIGLARASKRLAQVEANNKVLGSIFKDLNYDEDKPEEKPLRAVLGERLDQATAALQGEAIGDPLAVARMQATLGVSQLGLGYYDKGIALLEKARPTLESRLGPDHPESLECSDDLADGYLKASQVDRALPLAERVLERRRATLGPDHPESLKSLAAVAACHNRAGRLDRAVALQNECWGRWKSSRGPDDPGTIVALAQLAAYLADFGQLARAIPLAEEALNRTKATRGPDSPETLGRMDVLAYCYWSDRQFNRAVPLFEELVERAKAVYGPDHPSTLVNLNNLSNIYGEVGQANKAIPLNELVLEKMKVKLGPDHQSTLIAMNNLACRYQDVGKFDKAIPLAEETWERRRKKFGPDHPATLKGLNTLAEALSSAGQVKRALPLYEEAFRRMKATLGPDHPNTLIASANLMKCYLSSNRPDRAITIGEETFGPAKAKFGPDHPTTLAISSELTMAYQAVGRVDRAIPIQEEALAKLKAKVPPDDRAIMSGLFSLASIYEASGDAGRAAATADELVDFLRGRSKQGTPDYPRTLALLGKTRLDLKQWPEAETALREALAIRERDEPGRFTTFSTKSALGGALLGQKKYDEAAPLLKAGYEGMAAQIDKVPPPAYPRFVDAIDRLIKLAEETNKPDDAARWRAAKEEFVAKTSGGPKK